MKLTDAQEYALDKAALELQTVAELTLTLQIAEVAGRSKATTKAKKIEMILRVLFGYIVFTDDSIGRDTGSAKITPQASATPKPPAKPRKEPSRRELALKAQVYGWDVIHCGGIYIVQHQNAHNHKQYMVKSTSLPALARRLSKLITEWQCATAELTQHKFLDKYLFNNTEIN